MKGQNSNGQILICGQTTGVLGTDGITPPPPLFFFLIIFILENFFFNQPLFIFIYFFIFFFAVNIRLYEHRHEQVKLKDEIIKNVVLKITTMYVNSMLKKKGGGG
jgi:hypothetical protein